MKVFRALVLPLALVLALGLSMTAMAHRVKTVARLTGAGEVPGPGDPDGRGRAVLRLNDEKGKVCYRVSFSNIGQPTGGHIHRGTKTESGDVVVTLFSSGGPSPLTGCATDVPSSLIRSIQKRPANFYVNVHNEEFPAGAIRGQLRRVD